MTDDALIEAMARAAWEEHSVTEWEKLPAWLKDEKRREAIAALAVCRPIIEAQERERCAQICDKRYMGDNTREDMEAKRCAAAIRSDCDE